MMSEESMPSVEERKRMLMEYAKKCNILDSVKLETIISKIVSETLDYSLAGYCMFGKKEEFEKLEKVIQKLDFTINTPCNLT